MLHDGIDNHIPCPAQLTNIFKILTVWLQKNFLWKLDIIQIFNRGYKEKIEANFVSYFITLWFYL